MIYLASLKPEINDKLSGYYHIKTITELNKVVVQTMKFNKIIIRKDFVESNFTPVGFSEYINQIRLINPNISIVLEEGIEFNNDSVINDLKELNSIDDIISMLFYNEKEFFNSFKELVSKKIDTNDKLTKAANVIALQQIENDKLRREKEDLEHQLEIERKNKQYIKNALSTIIGRINFQYGVKIDENRLFYTDDNMYNKILYIKELTRVQYVDSLVYYLQQILKIIYGIPVRILCIESFYATGKVELYNFIPHYKLKEKDVISSDILMLGVQPKLLKDILKNPSNISILIILDRCGYIVPHVIGDNVEYFYTVSDLGDKPENIPNARCISYSMDALNIHYIKGFSDMDASKKLSLYSSMKIVKDIIKTLEVSHV